MATPTTPTTPAAVPMEPAHNFMSADELEALGVVRFLTNNGALKYYLLTAEQAMVTQDVDITYLPGPQAKEAEARKWRLFGLGSSGPLNQLRQYVQSTKVIGGPQWRNLQEQTLMHAIGPIAFVRLVTAGAFDV